MKIIKLLIITLAASVLLSGCIAVDGYFKSVRNKVFKSVDGDFHKEVEFSFGAAALTLSSVAVSFSDAPDFTDDMLRKIDRVQIGVYESEDRRNYKPNYSALKEITKELEEDGYRFIFRTNNREEMAAVMIKGDANKIKEMFVIVFEEKLVMTQIFGDLDELVEIVIRSEGLNVEVAHN